MNAPISPLVAGLMMASLTQTRQVTQRVIDSLTAQITERNAEIDAVRTGVMALLDGPYMPTPAAIQAALWPTPAQVALTLARVYLGKSAEDGAS